MKSKQIKQWVPILLAFLLVFSVAEPIHAASQPITLSKTKVSMYVGGRTKLSLKKKTGKKLVWKSSNKKIVAVSQKGSIKAKSAGTATITVRIKGTKTTAKAKISVGEAATKLTLKSAATVLVKLGDTSQVKASVAPKTTLYTQLIYKSDNTEIATIDKKGKITAKSEGMTQIEVTTKALGKKGKPLKKTIQVIVTKAEDTASDEPGTAGNGTVNGGGASASAPLLNTFVNGTTKTYVLNKTYSSSVTLSLSVNGQSFTYTEKISAILNDLATTYTTRTNSAGTITVSRKAGDEWWTVTDPSNGNALLFKVKADESAGQIMVEDTSGTVNVSVY